MRAMWLARLLVRCLAGVPARREPDALVGKPVHMRRWWIVPRNSVFNVYLHHTVASDSDRELHDHPYLSLSVCLSGVMWEELLRDGDGRWVTAGSVIMRRPSTAHRFEVSSVSLGCWTLFITGPRVREWGFHCPGGWVHWEKYLGQGGCGETKE